MKHENSKKAPGAFLKIALSIMFVTPALIPFLTVYVWEMLDFGGGPGESWNHI